MGDVFFHHLVCHFQFHLLTQIPENVHRHHLLRDLHFVLILQILTILLVGAIFRFFGSQVLNGLHR